MKAEKLLGIMAIFSLLSLLVSWSEAGQPIKPNPSTESAFSDQNKMMVKGKIAFLGGRYYVLGQDPPGELMIVNPDPTVLGNHMKEGKILTIEGHWDSWSRLIIHRKN